MTRMILTTIVLAMGLARQDAPTPKTVTEQDVYNKQGVYVESQIGLYQLTSYTQARQGPEGVTQLGTSRGIMQPETLLRAFDMRDGGLQAPIIQKVVSVLVNLGGWSSDLTAAQVSMVFVVMPSPLMTGDPAFRPMSTRVGKLRPTLFQATSPELTTKWIAETFASVTGDKNRWGDSPRGYVGLVMQPGSGQPLRLYPIRVRPE